MTRRFLWLLGAVLPGLLAEPLTRGERDRAMSELHATRKRLLDSIDGLSKAQWSFKSAPDVWSVAQIAEHVTLTEETLMNWIKKALSEPASPARRGSLKSRDEEVLKGIADRSRKAQAPEFLQPKRQWPDSAGASAEFRKRRDATIAYVDSTPDDLRAHFAKHRLGEVDAYQLLYIMAGHTERHVRQIEEVKADPGFPKK